MVLAVDSDFFKISIAYVLVVFKKIMFQVLFADFNMHTWINIMISFKQITLLLTCKY